MGRSTLRLLIAAIAFVLVAGACRGGGDTEREDVKGGTFGAAMESDVLAGFDPQKEYYQVSWALYRCCLLRTLLSYNGRAADEGGHDLTPDLATELPEVSDDQLTWTFPLKPGIRYAPPLEDIEVTATDVIRALERTACSACSAGGYPFFYSVIEGFDDVAAGEADRISGLAAPDAYTLTVRLVQPTPDLPHRFSLATTAPIPPGPGDDGARLGVAEGHDENYGRFLVATGPYMLEGADEVDFSLPADAREPATGYEPDRSIVLVRNPSWEPDSDDFRRAAIDRLEIEIGDTVRSIANKLDREEIDLGIVQHPPEQIERYSSDPELRPRLHVSADDAVLFVSLNIAQPPLDDVYIRRAVSLAIDKDALRRRLGGPLAGEIAGHIIPDALLEGALEGLDPYATPGDAGDIEAAKREMARSAYDLDADGVCDADPCGDVRLVTDAGGPFGDHAAIIAGNLEPLGLTLDVKELDRGALFAECLDPSAHVGMCVGMGWGKDYADPVSFGPGLFASYSIGPDGCCNTMMVGAPEGLLAEHGYEAAGVPNVDGELEECIAASGEERVRCWADFDRLLMDEVVPMVPVLFPNAVHIVSSRVQDYSFDAFSAMIAFDQIALSDVETR